MIRKAMGKIIAFIMLLALIATPLATLYLSVVAYASWRSLRSPRTSA